MLCAPPPQPLPQDTGVVINFSVQYSGADIYYSAPNAGYYTINVNSERIFMPGEYNQNIDLTEKNANYITLHSPSITVLSLFNCSLTAVPDLTSLTGLIDLNLENNTLTEFINSTGILPASLTILYLTSCGLTDVPDLTSLDSLTYLNLNFNTLTEFTNSTGILPASLRRLYLFDCNLTAFPNLTSLNSLVELDLQNNSILETGFNSFDAFKTTPISYLRNISTNNGDLFLSGNTPPLSPAGIYGGWVTTTGIP